MDLAKVKLEEVTMRLVTKVGDGVIIDEKIDSDEKFMADLVIALRNGKSPADALAFLADLGSDHLNDPEAQTGRANHIGVSRWLQDEWPREMRSGDAVIHSGRNAHVISIPPEIIPQGCVPIMYDDEAKCYVSVPADGLIIRP